MIPLNQNLYPLQRSQIRVYTNLAKATPDCAMLTIGEPDFDTPEVIKAAAIALMDIMPILGTGGIMIPWAVISLVLGYTKLGLELFLIYGIVTVVRNYVEPKIVGAQLSLHPIITLVSMFIGLRLFGFWGLFGLPVGISFLWKQKQKNAPD